MDERVSRFGDEFKARELTYRQRLNNSFSETPDWFALRLDGRAFHTYTKQIGATKPFDGTLHDAMCFATEALCKEIPGARVGYTQSDEISIIFSTGVNPTAELWFGGVVPKILTISASLCTTIFNAYMSAHTDTPGLFDARVISLPSEQDALDYLHWRFIDAKINSVSAVAQRYFSSAELHGKNHRDKKTLYEGRMLRSMNDDYARKFLVGSGVFKKSPDYPPVGDTGTPNWVTKDSPDWSNFCYIPYAEDITAVDYSLP